MLDRQERELYGGAALISEGGGARGHESPAKKSVQRRIISEEKSSARCEQGKRRARLFIFSNSKKKKFRIKGGTAWLKNQIY
jgi:hypothetical protein